MRLAEAAGRWFARWAQRLGAEAGRDRFYTVKLRSDVQMRFAS